MFRITLVVVAALAAVGCGPKIAKVQIPAGPPEHEVLFAQGQAAFREATPEGYLKSAEAFRKASVLSPEHCEYPLHLAQSLMFLAMEQKLNQEDFAPTGKEASEVIAAIQTQPCAARFAPLLSRVQALSTSPGQAQAVVGNAVIQIQESTRGQESTDAINRALEADPADAMNWLVLWKLSPYDPRGPLLKANELAPDLPIVQYEMGTANTTLTHYPAARVNFERALALSSRHFHSMLGLAYSLAVTDPDTNEVLPLYLKAVDVAPKYLEGHALLGYYYDQIEESDKAIAQYRTIVELNPKYEPGQLSLGIAIYKANQFDASEQALVAAVALDSRDSQAHFYRASIWLTRNDLPRAQDEAELAIRTAPTFVEAFCLLGVILERESRIDEALAQYERALRIKRDYPDALMSRGNIRAQRSQFADAVADFTAAIDAYRSQISALEKEATKAEASGFLLKARAERRRKSDTETAISRAEEIRKRVLAVMPEASGR